MKINLHLFLKKDLNTNWKQLRRCKIENYIILRVRTLGLPKIGGGFEPTGLGIIYLAHKAGDHLLSR